MMKVLPKYSSGPYITITLVTKVMHFIYFLVLANIVRFFLHLLTLLGSKTKRILCH